MKRIVVAVLLVLVLVGSGVIALMVRDRDRLLRESAQSVLAQKALEYEAGKLRGELAHAKAELLKAQNDLMAATATAAEAKDATLSGEVVPSKDGATPVPPKQGMKVWAEMLKKPEMKEMMKQQQLAMMESQYSGLFAKFQLDDAEKADFKHLLSERLMAEAEAGIKYMNGDLTAEQRAALGKEAVEAKKASDTRIREFLNNEADYTSYRNWEDTKGERMQLDMGRNIFSSSGEPLSAAQEEQLVRTMHETNVQPSDVPDLSKPQNFDPTQMNPAMIARQLSFYDRKAQAIQTSAAQFLSPRQLESLAIMQKQWRDMSEAGLKMSSAMFQTELGTSGTK